MRVEKKLSEEAISIHAWQGDDVEGSEFKDIPADRLAPRRRLLESLDYFDASINRVGAWVIGTRNMQKALLIALLEPVGRATAEENAWDFTARMAVMEAAKALPWGAVWQHFCESNQIPQDFEIMTAIHQYEKDVQFKRG